VCRASPDADDEEIDRLIDRALDFTPGRGRSRDQALRVNWRGAFVNTARQAGATFDQIAERLRMIEPTARPLTKRHLIDCAHRAAEFEERIDGSCWVRVDASTTRGLSSGQEVYRRAQRRVLGLNQALLLAAGSAERVEAFLTERDPAPSWLEAFGTPRSGYAAKAAELRAERCAAVRERDRAAQTYRQRTEAGLHHLAPEHRPAIDSGSRLDDLDELIRKQRRDLARDAAAANRPVARSGLNLVERLPHSERHGVNPGREHSRRSRAAQSERQHDAVDGKPRYRTSFRTGDVGRRIDRLEETLSSTHDSARRGQLEAQIVGLRQLM
jgi:hypothetical protein